MKHIKTTAFLFFLAHICLAQPVIDWQKTIGGDTADNFFDVVNTTDGGFLFIGESQSNISGDKNENCIGLWDYWIVKLDSIGNIQWENTIGGSENDWRPAGVQTNDGGYIVGGTSNSHITGDKTENCMAGSQDYWIVKLDAGGNILWQNAVGGSGTDIINDIRQTPDGGYILGGLSHSNISGDKTQNSKGDGDYWIVRLDSAGNVLWDKTIGGSLHDVLVNVVPTFDGGYFLAGFSQSGLTGDKAEYNKGPAGTSDYWVIKLNSAGGIDWQNTIGGNNMDDLESSMQTTDGGFVLAGSSNSGISSDKHEVCNGGVDYWIVKLDALGNMEWENTIGGDHDDYLTSIKQTTYGYLIFGSSDSDSSFDKNSHPIGFHDFWLVKIDTSGIIQWQKTIGGAGWDWARGMDITADGNIVIGGYSDSNISGDKTENSKGGYDGWILKLVPSTITSTSALLTPQINFEISPNPVKNVLTVKNCPATKLKIKNSLGKTILQSKTNGVVAIMDVSSLAPGIYFIQAGFECRKFFKL